MGQAKVEALAIRAVALNSVLLTISTVATKIATFAYIFIIMRCLGPEGYGKYALAYSFVAMLSFGSELGLTTFTVREVAANPSAVRAFASSILRVRLLLALATFFAIAALGCLITSDPATRLAIVLFAVAMVLDSVGECFTGFFYAFQRMGAPALAGVLRASLIAMLVALFALQGYGLVALVSATAFGAAAGAIITGFVFIRRFFLPQRGLDRTLIVGIVKTALPYAAMALITNLFFRIDMVILSLMKGDVETGLYGAAYRIMESLLFLTSAVNTAALPAMSRLLSAAPTDVNTVFRSALRWLIMLGVPASVGLTVLARPVMTLFGSDFMAAAPALQVLSWALLLMLVNRFTGTLLTAAGCQVMLVKVCAVLLGVNVLLNLVLIPPFGRMGAAWVTFVCECVLMPTLFLAVRRYLDLRGFWAEVWRPCVAAAGMGLFCSRFADMPLALLIPAGAALYGLLLGFTHLRLRT